MVSLKAGKLTFHGTRAASGREGMRSFLSQLKQMQCGIIELPDGRINSKTYLKSTDLEKVG